jgi:hypothetical protein
VVTGDGHVLDWLTNAGVRVPEDVGVAWLAAYKDKTISGVDQNCYLTGVTAMDFLAGMLYRNERGVPVSPLRILVEGTWHEGQTVRRVNLEEASRSRQPAKAAAQYVRGEITTKPRCGG